MSKFLWSASAAVELNWDFEHRVTWRFSDQKWPIEYRSKTPNQRKP
jgi:hypothetical protein